MERRLQSAWGLWSIDRQPLKRAFKKARKKIKMCAITICEGDRTHYYPTFNNGSFNFHVLSAAGPVSVALFDTPEQSCPTHIVPMFATPRPEFDATSYSVRINVPTPVQVLYYRLMINGEQILDPFALETTDDLRSSGAKVILPKCVARPITLRTIRRPKLPMSETVIQEVNLYAYTDSGYCGLIDKIDYLKSLCTTVEAMPLSQGDPFDCGTINPTTNQPNRQAWFYNSMLYCAPSANLASSRCNAMNETMALVDALHQHDMEFVVDFVFNHTREGGLGGPVLHFKALGLNRYYVVENGYLTDRHTGCSNELNVHDPLVVEMILATLRFWYNVIGVDGVRFDLFAVLGLNPDLVTRIINDAELKGLKIFPEPWATGGLYMLGGFGQNTCEWNDRYRDDMRDWLRGQFGKAGAFTYAVAGSVGTFQPWEDHWSCNFITCHDGFTLWDLLSWNWKNNLANGEDNRDGTNENRSWNCGPDGAYNGSLDADADDLSPDIVSRIRSLPEQTRTNVSAFRERQFRNASVMLYLSQGVLLDLYGNEIARTQDGNNNAYCQLELVRMPWQRLMQEQYATMLKFRQQLFAFRQVNRINDCWLYFHGTEPGFLDRSSGSRFAAVEFIPKNGCASHIYWASNVHDGALTVNLPQPPSGTQWHLVHNSAYGFEFDNEGGMIVAGALQVESFSNVILIAR